MKSPVSLFVFSLFTLITMASAADQPNFIVINIDDLGYADIGAFGSTLNRTPHLDRMAKEGRKLTAYYAAPVCSPSRAALLTGSYPKRALPIPHVLFPAGAVGLHPDEITVAEVLREAGYRTGCVGKWHLGDQPEFLPTSQGFDYYLGIPYSNDMGTADEGTKSDLGAPIPDTTENAAKAKAWSEAPETGLKGMRQPPLPLVENDKVVGRVKQDEHQAIVATYTEAAVKFVRENAEKPFFLYLPHTAIHTPIYPGAKFRGKSSNGRVGDWIEEVDWSTGRVLDTLREIAPNTLVIFTSDNGPWLIKKADSGSAGPLRGGKGSTWEGGVRVPTLAWWPGKIAPGTIMDAVSGTIDLLPTAVAVAGGTLPTEPVIDGRDLSPILLGKTKDSPRGMHYYFSGYQLQAVREGPWKLALLPQNETMGRPVSPDAQTNEPRLYNLDREIGERTNLATKHPDVVTRLTALASKMSAEIGGKNPAARRPAGKVGNPQFLYPSERPGPRPNAAKKPGKQAKPKLR